MVNKNKNTVINNNNKNIIQICYDKPVKSKKQKREKGSSGGSGEPKKYLKDNFFILKPKSQHIPQPLFEHQTIEFSNIFEYADIISSTKQFVCLYSGSMVLAAAIKDNNIDCYFPPHESYTLEKQKPYYYFNNVNYFETL